MSEERTVTVRVRLLERDFPIACPEGESEGVLRAASFLEARMQEARRGGLVGLERIAVLVALNLAHEHLELQEAAARGGGPALERLAALNRRLALRLAETGRSPSSAAPP